MTRSAIAFDREKLLFKHFCLGSALPHFVLAKPDGNCVLPVQAYQGALRLRPLICLDRRALEGSGAPDPASQIGRSPHEVVDLTGGVRQTRLKKAVGKA
jgi:hypothetical protein